MRPHSLTRLLPGLVVALCSLNAAAAVADTSLTASQMFIEPSSFPIGEYTRLATAPDGSLHFTAGRSPVVGFRVCPTEMLRPEDAYVATRDYRVILRSNGDVDAIFNRPGVYMVRLVRRDGSSETFWVGSRVQSYNTCFTGVDKEFACPNDPYQYVGTDVSGFDDGFTNRKVVTTIQDLVDKVCTDYNAAGHSPIGITIADHGCEGAFFLNGQKVSLDAADAARLALFCTLKGKICNLTLIACSTAHGQAGHDFICKLSECLGGIQIRSWETDISVNHGSTYVWSTANPVPFVKGNPWNSTPYKPSRVPDKVTWDIWYQTPLASGPAAAGTTVLYSQTFNAGATCVTGGWTSVDLTFGLYGFRMGLFPGTTQVQQDPCATDLSCLWAAILGSTETYACGGFPTQAAVPKGLANGQYLHNEIWSPNIPLAGAGNAVTLKFSVYREMPRDNLVFYTWRVRDIVGGVPSLWKDRGFVYYGGQKDWLTHTEPVGDLLNLAAATHVQIALGVWDQCGAWCGIYGTGACHSHAPLIDNVKLYRIDSPGPQWSIRDIEQFQDNFASDGTTGGTVRADAALDILPLTSPGVLPGDTAVVRVVDPTVGIATDPNTGTGPAVYIYVAVWPRGQPSKSGPALTQNAVRWPYLGTTVAAGTTWYCLRMDNVRLYDTAIADAYCVDLNDNLFTPGDTICFFYCAQNTNGVKTYAFCSNLTAQGTDIQAAASDPAEFTCLPAGGWNLGGDILYVDGMDGFGAQTFFDTAFQQLGILGYVDRYDVRGSTSLVGNWPGSRIIDVNTQLLGCYRKILVDFGDSDLSGDVLADFSFSVLNTFLAGLTNPGGVYLCGDDLPTALAASSDPSAVMFRSVYMPYTLTSSNHASLYGMTPVGRGTAGHCFNGDTFIIYGGCPLRNDFDVMAPAGGSIMEVSYGTPAATNGAVLSKVTNNGTTNVGVLLSGFSFMYLKDDDTDGVLDRADHLHDILTWLGNVVGQPTDVRPARSTSLGQNYPNPFNPTTTISFYLARSSDVLLEIFDARGARVRTLVRDHRKAGSQHEVWDGRNDDGQPAASGVYFYRLKAGEFSANRKMVLLK